MSSNEEYLDSLLKSVTAKEQAGNGDFSNELSKGTEENSSVQGNLSSDALEQILASEESLEAGMQEDTEMAFSDPGALFFSEEDEEENFDDSFFAIEDIPEEDEEDIAVNAMEEDIFAAGDSAEEDVIAAVDSMEEDVTAMTDGMEEDVIAAADSMEEDVTAMIGGMEEDVIAAADSMEEDVTAMTDGMEEDVIAAADNMEEDAIAMTDGMEEDVIAAADNMEEDIFAMADGMEEDVIAAADNMEEDFIGMADSVEEMPDNSALEDEGFKEINDLLASSGDGDDDMFAMLEGVGNEEEGAGIDIGFFDEEENNEEPVEESKKERKKKEKERKKREREEKRNKRKKKQNEETEEGTEAEANMEAEEDAEELVSVGEAEKKPGIFRRFVDFLMEEDDEEEEGGKVRIPIGEDDDLFVGEEAGENEAILQELSKEDEEKKSGKADKKKKKKDKKGKKGKNAEDNQEADEDDVEEESVKEKKKAKKEKKKKKEKPVEEIVPEKPEKKLSVKKIEVTAVFCLTILAAILLAVHLLPPTIEKNKARDAYYAKDYEKVVEGFYNEELSDSDSIMYNRAYTILRLQRKIDGYNNYMRMGKETEALNQLIEGVIRYKEIYADAEQYNVTAEVDELYQMITDALENKYGISTTVAEGIYTMEDKLAYTLKLESIINGTEYVEPVYDDAEETETAEE